MSYCYLYFNMIFIFIFYKKRVWSKIVLCILNIFLEILYPSKYNFKMSRSICYLFIDFYKYDNYIGTYLFWQWLSAMCILTTVCQIYTDFLFNSFSWKYLYIFVLGIYVLFDLFLSWILSCSGCWLRCYRASYASRNGTIFTLGILYTM